jgi:hypothetical protein
MTNWKKIGTDALTETFANKHIVAGILMRKYQNVSLIDLPLRPYDLIVELKENDEDGIIIKARIKVAKKSVSFIGRDQGSVSRKYKSEEREYIQSTKTSDVVIGINPIEENSFDLYFIPTILIEQFETRSKSIGKVAALKNNYEFFEKCKDHPFILQKAKQLNVID